MRPVASGCIPILQYFITPIPHHADSRAALKIESCAASFSLPGQVRSSKDMAHHLLKSTCFHALGCAPLLALETGVNLRFCGM